MSACLHIEVEYVFTDARPFRQSTMPFLISLHGSRRIDSVSWLGKVDQRFATKGTLPRKRAMLVNRMPTPQSDVGRLSDNLVHRLASSSMTRAVACGGASPDD